MDDTRHRVSLTIFFESSDFTSFFFPPVEKLSLSEVELYYHYYYFYVLEHVIFFFGFFLRNKQTRYAFICGNDTLNLIKDKFPDLRSNVPRVGRKKSKNYKNEKLKSNLMILQKKKKREHQRPKDKSSFQLIFGSLNIKYIFWCRLLTTWSRIKSGVKFVSNAIHGDTKHTRIQNRI